MQKQPLSAMYVKKSRNVFSMMMKGLNVCVVFTFAQSTKCSVISHVFQAAISVSEDYSSSELLLSSYTTQFKSLFFAVVRQESAVIFSYNILVQLPPATPYRSNWQCLQRFPSCVSRLAHVWCLNHKRSAVWRHWFSICEIQGHLPSVTSLYANVFTHIEIHSLS